jgi:pyridoxamine 5'-phosphate oxidase
VTRVSDAEADAYFATRSRDSQLGAWASDQSQPLPARAVFLNRIEEARARFDGADVPRPPQWSGFRVAARRIEFWQDRDHRLHERTLYTRNAQGGWDTGLLFP